MPNTDPVSAQFGSYIQPVALRLHLLILLPKDILYLVAAEIKCKVYPPKVGNLNSCHYFAYSCESLYNFRHFSHTLHIKFS
jgi:hypothetical protein